MDQQTIKLRKKQPLKFILLILVVVLNFGCDQISKIIEIVKKRGKAFKQRGIQIGELKSFIENSPYPIILAGDFNDTPSSFAYQQMNEILDDTFIKRGKGIGPTYNGTIPLLRIDYIFIDKKFSCTNYQKNNNPNSDHFPIIADIVIPN